MKRIFAFIIAIFLLSSCAKSGISVSSDFDGEAVAAALRWETDKGTYFTSTSLYLDGITTEGWFGPGDYDDFIGDPLLLYITDAATGDNLVLCYRPSCSHDSEDCSAYLPYDVYEEDLRSYDLRTTSIIFADGGYIYAHNAGSRIFRFNLDGTGRTEAVRIPNIYHGLSGGWLMNGKLYAQALCFKKADGYIVNIVKVLLEIDYISGSVREIWEENTDRNTSASIFAISDGIFYGIEKIYPYRFTLTYADENERLEFHYNTENILFSINPDDDSPLNIIHSGTEHEFNPYLRIDSPAENPGIYYHSRRDEAAYRLDLTTGEAVKVAENITGTLQITGVFGGRIFMADFLNDSKEGFRLSLKRGATVDSYIIDDSTKMHETLFIVDMATGEISESAFITRRALFQDRTRTERNLIEGGFSGNTDGFADIIYEEDGYFYIEIERWEREADVWGNGRTIHINIDRILLGRIPAEDYFSGNINAVEELDWIEAEEFFELRERT